MAGTLQRARKTPQTMMRETVIGETFGLTSLIGASAPPSQAPAANPQRIPIVCKLRSRSADVELSEVEVATTCGVLTRGVNGGGPEGRNHPATHRAESRSE